MQVARRSAHSACPCARLKRRDAYPWLTPGDARTIATGCEGLALVRYPPGSRARAAALYRPKASTSDFGPTQLLPIKVLTHDCQLRSF